MLTLFNSSDTTATIEALNRSQAVIEFEPNGIIITANDNFLKTVDYALDEIKGHHHSMFVAPEARDNKEYRDFWLALNRGEFQSGEFKRIAKGGKEVWLQASYNPIFDINGRVFKVVKYASDITAQMALRDSEKVKNMVDKMPINVMMCDPKTFKINYANETTINTLKAVQHLIPIKAEELARNISVPKIVDTKEG